jgi:hypothetical protein
LTEVAVAWPWITASLLAALSFVLPAERVQGFWTIPFWTVWLIPVAAASLMLTVAYRESSAASRKIPA